MKHKASDYRSLGELFFDESIRLDKIIWIAASSDGHDDFEEFIEQHDRKERKEVFGVSLSDDPEEALSQLARANKQGFLVQAATPIPVAFHENGCTTHGFGWCQLCWFYTDTLDDAFADRLLEWKESVHAKARKKLAAKATA